MDEDNARRYDAMIPWDKRLKREIPVIREFLSSTTVLDVACSSGRHSFALEDYGFECTGIDISEPMIGLANELKKEGSKATFMQLNAADPRLIDNFKGVYFDNAIMLGNAIANLGNLENGMKMIGNIFRLLAPGGRFFVQTVHRPSKPHYLPLRMLDGMIIQRIMVPVIAAEYNVELHVNAIDPKGEYDRRTSDNQFYMYTREEFQRLVEKTGFVVEQVYGGYNREKVEEKDGETQIWLLKKPEIIIEEATLQLFSHYELDEAQIRDRVLDIWRELMDIHVYHCIRGYRFLYPRISSHPLYDNIKKRLAGSKIMDIGCNLGTDIRFMIVDGASDVNMMGFDLHEDYFELGYRLYGDRDSLRCKFIAGDVLKGLDGYNGFDIIHTGSLLHLFEKEQVELIIKHVVVALVPGGLFFGRTVGLEVAGDYNSPGGLRYLHSPASLRQLLEDLGFKEVEVLIIDKSGPMGEKSQGDHLSMAFKAIKS